MSESTPQPPYGQPGSSGAAGSPGGDPSHGRPPAGADAYPQPGQPGQPGQPAYGQPGQHGQPGFHQPGPTPGTPHGQPHPGYPPPRQHHGDDNTWALMNYVGLILLGFLAPLIIYFVKRGESRFVRFHAAQALNLTITLMVYSFGLLGALFGILLPSIEAEFMPGIVAGAILGFVGIFGLIIVQLVYLILAITRSARYEWYALPTWLCWRMVK